MESLDDIGSAELTDKASGGHHYTGHRYADLYELLFRGWRYNLIEILEIGVLDGASIRMWRRYFPRSYVTAIDSEPEAKFPADPSVECILGDAYSEEVISRLAGREFDLMLDDGDHQVESQLIFLRRYSPLLRPTGIMIIEDILTRDGARSLKSALPDGFACAIIEMAEGSSIIDSRLFIAYRK